MVAAKETALRSILEGTKQYQVPLYQRTYSWTLDQVQRLWSDVVDLTNDRIENEAQTHFIGSLVLAPSPSLSPAGVQHFLVIDGQQRLTTLTLLLAAIREHRAKHEDTSHRERINDQFLINKWQEDQPLKVLPTQKDQDAYNSWIRGVKTSGSDGGIGTASRYFQAQLLDYDDPDDPLDVDRLEAAVIDGLTLVAVTAQSGDNVHRIFESLNNTGLQLTQGDLLRNYFFMRLIDRAQIIYDSIWKPMQEALDASSIELLFWIDLVRRDPTSKRPDVYSLQQSRLDRLTPGEVENDLDRISELSRVLVRVLNPEQIEEPKLRLRVQRIRDWKSVLTVPVMVSLMEIYEQDPSRMDEICTAMLYLESFLVRRTITGVAPGQKNLNRILLSTAREVVDAEDAASTLRSYLSSGRKNWSTDEQIRSAVPTVPFYWQGRAHQKRLILTWLDQSLGSKGVDYNGLTIEHLVPQTITDDWRKLLAKQESDPDILMSRYESTVQTLGNLTLTAYNSEMSNNPWDWKRDYLKGSAMRMNHEIAENSIWGFDEIEQRSRELSEAVIKIWPGPDLDLVEAGPDDRWRLMEQVLIEVPPGRWVSYGDLAAVVGTHAMPLANRLASHETQNAHRVLRRSGRISRDFKWLDGRKDDPRDVLEEEGLVFDDNGRADSGSRMTVEELVVLAGINQVMGAESDDE